MRNNHFLLLTGLCVLATCGCMQPVNSGAAAGGGARDENATPTTVIEPSHLPIGTDLDDEAQTTDDPCVKTRADKTAILKAYCAGCHSGPAAFGLPKFDFVLDDSRLVSAEWIREGQPPQRFVIPGDPDNSVLYTRVAVIGDMPAQPSDLATPRSPTPSLSDIAVLREWIAHCAGAGTAPPPPAGTGGSPAGGSGGAGGSPVVGGSGGSAPEGTGGATVGGTGGRGPAGTGGAGGGPAPGRDGGAATDAGVADGGVGPGIDGGGAADGGPAPGTCAATVMNGATCGNGAQQCRMGAQTCTCSFMQGMRRWVCR